MPSNTKHDPTVLDGARGAVHRLTSAQRTLNHHISQGGADRSAADEAYSAMISATYDAAQAAPTLVHALDTVRARLLTLAADADRDQPAESVLAELRAALLKIARDLGR